MRAHEFLNEQEGVWKPSGDLWDVERAKIDIIGLGHLILFGTVAVGKDAYDSIKALSKVGLTYPDLHQTLLDFYNEKKDPKADCIPVIKKWLVAHKPYIAGELHSDHWKTTPKSSNMMSSKETQHPPKATS
jgi:hypothetical protein